MKKMIQFGLLTVRHAFARRGQFPRSSFLPLPTCCIVLCGLLISIVALAQPAATSAQEANDRANALALAQKSMDQGNYDKAIELTTLVLQGWPGDPPAKEMLARAHMRKAMGNAEPAAQPPAPVIPAPTQTPPTDAGIAQPLETTEPPIPEVAPPKATKHEISVSGDFFMGEGTISLPFGYSIEKALGDGAGVPKEVAEADRSSLYYGGTLSYSYGQAWYFDLSYAMGSSSGNPVIIGLPSTFTLDDTWYQGYVRYTFPRLRGRRLSAYLRAGASFVQSTMRWTAPTDFGFYIQDNDAQDVLGNVGFGMRYTIYASRRFSVGIQGEGEGFYGFRSQDSTESLANNSGFEPESVTIDNTLMGGIGRGTLRLEYRVGSSGLFRIYGDVGFQAKFTIIDYPDGGGSQNELLWGPYAKIGVRYSF